MRKSPLESLGRYPLTRNYYEIDSLTKAEDYFFIIFEGMCTFEISGTEGLFKEILMTIVIKESRIIFRK